MTQVLRMSRKAFTVTVVAATIAWSIGLAALITPLATSAASSGDLIKASLPAVYYYGADNKRYVFPNEKTYMTWYSDFSGVQTITDAELAAIPIGGNVTYKPGVKMVKITTDPKVYAVDASGALRWVNSEAAAVALYGSDWNQLIDDIPDAFFTNYTVGADIAAVADFDKAAVSAAALSINSDKGLSTTADGALAVALSAVQPVGGTVPLSATGVEMLNFDVKNNGSAAVTLDSITVKRTGPGATIDFASQGINLYENGIRLTTGRSFNATTHEAVFGGINLTLAAGETRSLTVTADIGATGTALGGNVNSVSLTGVTAGSVSATGVGFTGPSFTLAGSSVGGVTIIKNSGTLANVDAGAQGAKVADFRLTAAATESMNFNQIALYYSGTANRANVTNLVLKQAGNTLATTAGITSGDLAVFTLDTPFALEKGTNRIFNVYADVDGGVRDAQTIIFYLDQTSDLYATGTVYGYGVAVTNTMTTGNTVTIDAGALVASFNGPSSATISSDSDQVELFNYTLTSDSNLEIRQTKFVTTLGGAAALTMLDNFKVIDADTGALIMGPIDVDTATETFTEVYTLTAGQARTFKVLSDISSAATTGDTFKITLGVTNLFDANKVRNLDNSTYVLVTDFVPSGVIAGNTHTVAIAGLTTSLASTPVAQTYVAGSQGVALTAINLKAADASDMTVSTVIFTGYTEATVGGGYVKGSDGTATVSDTVLTANLWDGATQVGDTKSPTTSTGGLLTFDGLNLVVPAGTTKVLTLKGNLASSIASVTTNDDNIKFQITTAATDVLCTDAAGSSVTNSGTTAGQSMTITSAGTLTYVRAPDDTESEAGFVVGGSSNVVLAKYKFTAANEELKVTKARINAATAAGPALVSLSLYDGSTLVGGPVSADNLADAYFTGMNFVIPKDGSNVLTVKANLNSVGAAGAGTGLDLTVTFEADTDFEARGTSAGSSTQITDAGTDTDGRTKIVRKSKPTVSLVALPSSLLSASTVVALRFTVTADAAGDVAIKKISATVAESIANGNTDVTIVPEATGNSSLRRVGDSTNLAGTSDLRDSSDAGCDGAENSCTFRSSFENEEVIAAGTSRTYDLRLTVAGTLAVGDTMSVNLLGDTTAEVADYLVVDDSGGAPVNAAPRWGLGSGAANDWAEYNFLWSDSSLVSHAACTDTTGATGCGDIDAIVSGTSSSKDWTNGRYIKVLPSDTKTMAK